MENTLFDIQIILYDVNYDINSFMAAPTVFRNLISHDCWYKNKIIILQTHKLGFIKQVDNNFVLDKSYNFGLRYCLKNKLVKKRKIISFCFHKLLSKLQDKFFFIDNLITTRIYKKIIKQYKINYVIRGATKNDGLKALIKTKKKFGINYSVILTDPIFYFPKTNGRRISKLEENLIKCSDSYFVPEFCFDTYTNRFNRNLNIKSFCFPVSAQLSKFDDCENNGLIISYFGTQRVDYNVFNNTFAYLAKQHRASLRLYGWGNNALVNETGGTHFNPVSGSQLICEILKANFLLAIDNPPHMTDLLPSKIVLYASTTKPIIIFGENDDSALLKFLKKIKYERYIYIKPTDSFELLDKFIKEYSNVSFDEECYKRQSDYYPSNVSQYVYNQIFGK